MATSCIPAGSVLPWAIHGVSLYLAATSHMSQLLTMMNPDRQALSIWAKTLRVGLAQNTRNCVVAVICWPVRLPSKSILLVSVERLFLDEARASSKTDTGRLFTAPMAETGFLWKVPQEDKLPRVPLAMM